MAYKYHQPKAYSPATTRRDIEVEFGRWNDQAGERVVTDSEMPYVKSNMDREAEVTFVLRGQRRRVAVRAWETFNVNFQCCYLIIRDMRLAEARGLTEAIREAYGLLAAPKDAKRDPWVVLNLPKGTATPVVKAQYRELAKKLHPDIKGGDAAAFKELDEAYKELTGEAPE